MAQITLEVYEGVIVVRSAGETHRFNRNDTGTLNINVGDHPDAEKPDTEEWTEFTVADTYLNGKKVERDNERTYKNNQYTVTVMEMEGGGKYLSIKRNDRHWKHDWRHLQRIKNELVGDEAEAVELYPAESRLVDEANHYHLWVLPMGQKYPFGFDERVVSDGTDQVMTGGRQRPFSEVKR